MGIQPKRVKEILESKKFQDLVKKRLTVSLSLTALMLIVYFGFILTIAFNKELLAVKIGEHITSRFTNRNKHYRVCMAD